MRLFLFLLLLIPYAMIAQVLPGVPVAGIPSGTLAEIQAIPTPPEGLMAYSTDLNTIYYYDGTVWVTFTDDQNASEVPLVTDVDVNGTTTDPSPVLETNVEEVVQAIAPITSKAGRVFYPPSIEIDASTTGSGRTVDLYQEYITQFGSPTAGSTGAPAAIPTYARTELYYYVTYADPTVFGDGTTVTNMSISGDGVLTYDIVNVPSDYNTLINVVFVVK